MVQVGIDAGVGVDAGPVGAGFVSTSAAGIGPATGDFTAAVQAMVQVGIEAGIGAADGASAIGEAVSSGAASGVVLTAMNGAIETMVANGIAAGMDAAKSASPSKVARRELGQPIGEGAALGVEDSAAGFAEAIREMVGMPLSALGREVDAAFDAGKRQREAAAAGIASAESLVGQTWDRVLGQIEGGPAADYLNQMRADMQSGRGGGSRGGGSVADRLVEETVLMRTELAQMRSEMAAGWDRPIRGEVTMDGATTSRVVVGHIAKQGRRAHEVGGGRRIR